MSFLKKIFSSALSEPLQNDLESALRNLNIEGVDSAVFQDKILKDANFKKGALSLDISLPFAARSLWPALEQQLSHALLQNEEVKEITVNWTTDIITHQTQNQSQPLPGVKNIIAVASGKGGVGKSTTSVNLALALKQEGAKVGILDADIYGPSVPTMLGIHDKPQTLDGKSMEPLEAHGLKLMSIGFLIDPAEPMIWRGPIVTQTLMQLLKETNWSDLDYLVIDLPPGTGDVQLTLSQQIPVTGAVVVTTPQEIALIDARKGLKMFEKVNIPILGIIENMSTHVCSQCGHEEAIFGEHGGATLATESNTKLLGQLPLDSHIRIGMDTGKPALVEQPAGEIAGRYRQMAWAIGSDIALQRKSYASVFPNIVVENS